jgi:hypothetical protein
MGSQMCLGFQTELLYRLRRWLRIIQRHEPREKTHWVAGFYRGAYTAHYYDNIEYHRVNQKVRNDVPEINTTDGQVVSCIQLSSGAVE